MSPKETATQTATAKVEISPAVRKMAEERLKVLASTLQSAESAQVEREEASRVARAEIDRLKAEQEEIAAFLKVH